nr:hypothetical protein CTI12_AA107650 [Tanacetum cinerariifolium]
MVRDANNQMFPIAWAVVRVENKFNWMWFLSLSRDNLNLEDDVALQSYLMLIRQCTRHIYTNFKKKWSGLQYKRLFWGAASTTMREEFDQIMAQFKNFKCKRLMEIKKKAQSWIEAYQYGIKPVFGQKMWKPSNLPKPLPPIERKIPGRPRTKRIRHPTKDENKVSRVSRIMHCHRCWKAGHNKKNCKKTARPKPTNFYTENPTENQNEHPTENPTENQNVNPTQKKTMSTTQNTTVNEVPTYLQDPVMPKTGQHSSVFDVPSMSNGRKKAKQVTKPALKKSKMGATIKKVHKISAEEHAILMDEEALRETRLDEQKEKEEQQRIRQIWREVEEADREFDTYANEFKD